MGYETKVILALLAKAAARNGDRNTYADIADAANVEGLTIKPFDEVIKDLAELDGNNAKATSSKGD